MLCSAEKKEPKNGGFSQRLCPIGKSSSRLKKCGFHDLELYPPNIDPAIPCHSQIQSFGKITFHQKSLKTSGPVTKPWEFPIFFRPDLVEKYDLRKIPSEFVWVVNFINPLRAFENFQAGAWRF
jgi:hypothetical protein